MQLRTHCVTLISICRGSRACCSCTGLWAARPNFTLQSKWWRVVDTKLIVSCYVATLKIGHVASGYQLGVDHAPLLWHFLPPS